MCLHILLSRGCWVFCFVTLLCPMATCLLIDPNCQSCQHVFTRLAEQDKQDITCIQFALQALKAHTCICFKITAHQIWLKDLIVMTTVVTIRASVQPQQHWTKWAQGSHTTAWILRFKDIRQLISWYRGLHKSKSVFMSRRCGTPQIGASTCRCKACSAVRLWQFCIHTNIKSYHV